jgi:hypothetical protein
VTQRSTAVARNVAQLPRPRNGLKRDLIPIMALLGAVYGWVLAGMAVIVTIIALLLN